MKTIVGRISIIGVLVSIFALSISATASAHVTVKPGEVTTASFQTFTVSVPNEKQLPTVSVRLVIPEDLTYVTPTQKQGWTITTKKSGTGEEAKVTSISWSGAKIDTGLRDEFTFSAKVPDAASELVWKAYQTYEDGTVVSWDKATVGGHDEDDANSGPFSVTTVVAETAQQTAITQAQEATANAQSSAGAAMLLGVAGILIGLVAIYFATRK